MRRVVVLGLVLTLLAGCGEAGMPDGTTLAPATSTTVADSATEAPTPAVDAPLPTEDIPLEPTALPDMGPVAIVDPLGRYLLGGAQNGAWLTPEELAPLLTEPRLYRIYSNETAPLEALGAPPAPMDIPCEGAFAVALEPADAAFETAFIATAGAGDLQPRPIEALDVNTPDYQEAMRLVLADWDIATDEVAIQQILRTDLNGDGVDEVLIQASTFGAGSISPDAQAGDYSFIMLRTVMNGTVQTVQVEGDFYSEAQEFVAPMVYTLDGVADLNGDGIMELIISSSYYEGRSKAVYTVDGTVVVPVIGAGCGV